MLSVICVAFGVDPSCYNEDDPLLISQHSP